MRGTENASDTREGRNTLTPGSCAHTLTLWESLADELGDFIVERIRTDGAENATEDLTRMRQRKNSIQCKRVCIRMSCAAIRFPR